MNESVGPAIAAPITPEDIRNKYIKHEASVKSIGTLYILGTFLLFGAGIVILFDTKEAFAARMGGALFLVVLGSFQFWVGTAVRKLESWVKIPVGVLSGLGLLAFPVGTAINAYILYLVFCEKGQKVFSPEYKHVIEATPYIKYKTSIAVWILVGIVVALLGIIVIGALLSR